MHTRAAALPRFDPDDPIHARALALLREHACSAFGAPARAIEATLAREFFAGLERALHDHKIDAAITAAYWHRRGVNMTADELVPGVSLERLLRAIAHVETSGGINNWPRIEVAYLPKGASVTVQGRVITGTGNAFTAEAARRYYGLPDESRLGSAASWSPWQILYHTAVEQGFDGLPHKLHDPLVAEPLVKKRLTKIALRGAVKVEHFADAWNSGSFRDSIIPAKYIADVVRAYKES